MPPASLHCFSFRASGSSLLFLHAPSPPEIYTLSLHDALPISARMPHVDTAPSRPASASSDIPMGPSVAPARDRKSTRLNSSHRCISYAVFCLKKKKCCANQLDHTGLRRDCIYH